MKCLNTVLQDVLIGRKVTVIKSRQPSYVNISGMVIDETRETLTIDDGSKRKVIVKRGTTFHVNLSDGTVVEVDGDAIVGRPEDRVKKRLRRRW